MHHTLVSYLVGLLIVAKLLNDNYYDRNKHSTCIWTLFEYGHYFFSCYLSDACFVAAHTSSSFIKLYQTRAYILNSPCNLKLRKMRPILSVFNTVTAKTRSEGMNKGTNAELRICKAICTSLLFWGVGSLLKLVTAMVTVCNCASKKILTPY